MIAHCSKPLKSTFHSRLESTLVTVALCNFPLLQVQKQMRANRAWLLVQGNDLILNWRSTFFQKKKKVKLNQTKDPQFGINYTTDPHNSESVQMYTNGPYGSIWFLNINQLTREPQEPSQGPSTLEQCQYACPRNMCISVVVPKVNCVQISQRSYHAIIRFSFLAKDTYPVCAFMFI